ncbi:cobalamin biosynthesis protein [Hoyosella sp. YIM 151337]|uniref:cobalamin biosynthesis protein n=1 Tax=Hoyosella sp. YIM 151337 TaxID=2992742 RepID=UPI002235F50C|nr:cobalamin biosynthesis protein [Hoyosella sp. YIM 151337]MCW4353902.1 cobalamin biosynthesis protein [Hoyosella sp. YIM 151337]
MNVPAVIAAAGLGLSARARAADITAMLRELAGRSGVVTFDAVATLDQRLHLHALSQGVQSFGLTAVQGFSAAELDDIALPGGSERIASLVGTASVAEAAAVLAALRCAETVAHTPFVLGAECQRERCWDSPWAHAGQRTTSGSETAVRTSERTGARAAAHFCVHVRVPKIIGNLVTGAVAVATWRADGPG